MLIRRAVKNDIADLNQLINSVYRGEDSKKNWTTESQWILTPRVTENDVLFFIIDPCVTLLILEDNNEILGCVKLTEMAQAVTLGLLSVRSDKQKIGLGRTLVLAAENYARSVLKYKSLEMHVLSQRSELLAWYERQGYQDTGRREPWQKEWGTTLIDLEFKVLQKSIDVQTDCPQSEY